MAATAPVTNSDLQAQLNVIQKDVKTVDGKVATVDSKIMNVDSKVNTSNSGINDIKKQLNSIEKGLDNESNDKAILDKLNFEFTVFDPETGGEVTEASNKVALMIWISSYGAPSPESTAYELSSPIRRVEGLSIGGPLDISSGLVTKTISLNTGNQVAIGDMIQVDLSKSLSTYHMGRFVFYLNLGIKNVETGETAQMTKRILFDLKVSE